ARADNTPVHSGMFEASGEDHFEAGLDDVAGGAQSHGVKLLVPHSMTVSFHSRRTSLPLCECRHADPARRATPPIVGRPVLVSAGWPIGSLLGSLFRRWRRRHR